MKYMLLIYSSTARSAFDDLDESEPGAVMSEYMTISQAPGTDSGAQLQPADTATTVRVQDGSVLTTDGPFAETKEELGGYYVIDAADLDAAIEVAGRIPAARFGGAVEVRPVVER